MNEEEFWGRGAECDFGNGTQAEDHDISKGPVPRGGSGGSEPYDCLKEQPSRLPEDYDTRFGGAPDSNPKSQYGIKKVPTHSRIPWIAIIYEGIVMALGGIKYGPFNWRKNSVAASVYVDAIERHLSLWNAGEDNDDESLVTHLAHVRACCGILIDAYESGNLIDDRPKNEAVIRAIKENYNVTSSVSATSVPRA